MIHMACRHGDAGCPWGLRLEKASKCIQDRHPCLPPSTVPPLHHHHHDLPAKPPTPLPIPLSPSHRLTYPSLSLALLYICLSLAADRPVQASSSISIGIHGDPLRTPTLRHGPYSVHSHVFFRPSDCEEASLCFDMLVPVAHSRECPTCMNHRYVHCSIRSLPCCVPRISLRNHPPV